MRHADLRRGLRVWDRWFPAWGSGTVRKVLRTRARIAFADGEVRTYDVPHLRFLEPSPPGGAPRRQALREQLARREVRR